MSSYKATLLRRSFQAFKDGLAGQLQSQAPALPIQGQDVAQGVFSDQQVSGSSGEAPAQVPQSPGPKGLSGQSAPTHLRAGGPTNLGGMPKPAPFPASNMKNPSQAPFLRAPVQLNLQVAPARQYFQQLHAHAGRVAFDATWQPPAAPAAQRAEQAQQQDASQQASSSSNAVPGGAADASKKKGSANSVHINKQIMACRSVQELLVLIKSRGMQFDAFNTSSALARVPKLLTGTDANTPDAVHLDHTGRTVMDCLGEMMSRTIDNFDARGLANASWAIGKTKYTPHASLPGLISTAARKRLEEFNPQNLSNLMWSQVYMHHEDPQLFAAVADKVIQRVGEFKPQELANIIWSFASLGYKNEALANTVARQCIHLAHAFKEQELSNVIWAYGKMGIYDTQLFNTLLAAAKAKLEHFLPQGVSNVAWACASVGHHDREFLDRVVRSSIMRLHSFDVQALSNLAWALANLGYVDGAFMGAVVREGMMRLDRMSPQNMCNMLWSCATIGFRDQRMLDAWAAQTIEKLAAFEPQGLSNIAWSFAKLGHHNPLLFDSLAAAVTEKADAFTSQGLSNTVYAFAMAQHVHPAMFSAVAAAMLRKMDAAAAGGAGAVGGASVQNCSVMVWAFATLRHYDHALFDAVLGRLVAELDECEPQNLASALWAFARMGHPLGEAGPLLAAQAVKLLPLMNQQEMCNTLRSLAVLDLLQEESFAAFGNALNAARADITAEGLHQAYHAQLVYHSNINRHAPFATKALPTLPEPLHTAAEAIWRSTVRDARASRLQQDVSAALSMAGVPNLLGHITTDGLFSVDISFEVSGRPVAVEIDGRHHYTSNRPHLPLSDVTVRRQLLEDRGWTVYNCSFMEWDMMGASLLQRGEALVARVAAQLGAADWQSQLPSLSASAAAAVSSAAALPFAASAASANPLASLMGGLQWSQAAAAASLLQSPAAMLLGGYGAPVMQPAAPAGYDLQTLSLLSGLLGNNAAAAAAANNNNNSLAELANYAATLQAASALNSLGLGLGLGLNMDAATTAAALQLIQQQQQQQQDLMLSSNGTMTATNNGNGNAATTTGSPSSTASSASMSASASTAALPELPDLSDMACCSPAPGLTPAAASPRSSMAGAARLSGSNALQAATAAAMAAADEEFVGDFDMAALEKTVQLAIY